MSRRWPLGLLLAFALAGVVRADPPGRFDYYLLALSWSPQYCASEARPGDSQCRRPYGFVVHGLWPQHERGWPKDCGQGEWLSEALIARMLPIMPSRPLILHEWKKHGVCSGLGAERYFEAVERAYRSVQIPERYTAPRDNLSLAPATLEADFRAANPGLKPDMLAVQCSGNYLRELRICLDRQLQPRACGAEARDRCGKQVVLRPSRP